MSSSEPLVPSPLRSAGRAALGRRPLGGSASCASAGLLSVALHAVLLPAWLLGGGVPKPLDVRAQRSGRVLSLTLSPEVFRGAAEEPVVVVRRMPRETRSALLPGPPRPVPPPPEELLEPALGTAEPLPRLARGLGPPAGVPGAPEAAWQIRTGSVRRRAPDARAHAPAGPAAPPRGRPMPALLGWVSGLLTGDLSRDLSRALQALQARATPPGDSATRVAPAVVAVAGSAAPTAGSPAEVVPAGIAAESPGHALGARPLAENRSPLYPGVARRRGWEGSVVLDVDVTAAGLAHSVTLLSSSGHQVLDQAARDAVLKWRFAPARQAGLAVPEHTRVTIAFQLRD